MGCSYWKLYYTTVREDMKSYFALKYYPHIHTYVCRIVLLKINGTFNNPRTQGCQKHFESGECISTFFLFFANFRKWECILTFFLIIANFSKWGCISTFFLIFCQFQKVGVYFNIFPNFLPISESGGVFQHFS